MHAVMDPGLGSNSVYGHRKITVGSCGAARENSPRRQPWVSASEFLPPAGAAEDWKAGRSVAAPQLGGSLPPTAHAAGYSLPQLRCSPKTSPCHKLRCPSFDWGATKPQVKSRATHVLFLKRQHSKNRTQCAFSLCISMQKVANKVPRNRFLMSGQKEIWRVNLCIYGFFPSRSGIGKQSARFQVPNS